MLASELLQSSMLTVLSRIVNETFITGFGTIEEVIDSKEVLVTLNYAVQMSPRTFPCSYVTQSGASLSVSVAPKKGDAVLVIALQHKDPESNVILPGEPIAIRSVSGYTILSAIALPVGFTSDASSTKISVGEEVVYDSSVDLSVKAPKITINEGASGASRVGDKVSVTIPANSFVVSVTGDATGTLNPTPVTVEGTIEEGSGSVLIGD